MAIEQCVNNKNAVLHDESNYTYHAYQIIIIIINKIKINVSSLIPILIFLIITKLKTKCTTKCGRGRSVSNSISDCHHAALNQKDDGNIYPFNARIDFRRPIMTSKVDPRTERVIIFIMAVYPCIIDVFK